MIQQCFLLRQNRTFSQFTAPNSRSDPPNNAKSLLRQFEDNNDQQILQKIQNLENCQIETFNLKEIEFFIIIFNGKNN